MTVSTNKWRGLSVKCTYRKSAYVCCVHCAREINLGRYEIDGSGNVTPDVECPTCHKSMRGLRLIGWPFEIPLDDFQNDLR
jgi:hypothetical protein